MKRFVGFAVVAAGGVVLFKLAMGLLGLAFSLLSTLLWWGLIAAAIYMVIKFVSPETAERIRSFIQPDPEPETEVNES